MNSPKSFSNLIRCWVKVLVMVRRLGKRSHFYWRQSLKLLKIWMLHGGSRNGYTPLRQFKKQGGFMLASEKSDGLGWRDRGCNQEWFERPSDGRG